jgi:putative ABC transport system permease protein
VRSWKDEVRQRLAAFDVEPHRSAEIIEELALHLEDRVEELRRRALTPEQADATARAELDRLDIAALARRVARPNPAEATPGAESTSGSWFRGAGADVRYGLRALRRQPGLSAVALGVLALGIGGSAGIFSVVNAVLLRPLPFRAPEQLVSFWGTAPEKGLPVVNYPDALYAYYRARSRTLSSLAMYEGAGFVLTGNGEAQRLESHNVTSEFFSVLGVKPAVGREFTTDEATRGKNLVAILSHGLWQRRFGGDPSIIGRSITLNDLPTTVVGIMPRGFDFPNHSQLWVPLGIDATSTNCWCYNAVGRLRTGALPDDVGRELDALNGAFWEEREPGRVETPKPAGHRGTIVKPLGEDLVGELRDPMILLLCGVGAVLLIACANLANLLLARAAAREREFAIRACVGASPRRIVRQLLVEGVLLAIGGAMLGLLVAMWISRVLGRFALERLPHLQTVGIDGRVVLFTAAVAMLTVLLFGLAPALRVHRLDLQSTLRDGGRGSRGSANRRLGDAFVVGQVALSLVLLVAAGLLVRSFQNLIQQDTGFSAGDAIVARVSATGVAYRSDTTIRRFYARLEASLRVRPEFSAVALASTAPFSPGNHQMNYFVEGKETRPDQPTLVTSFRSVTPTYFTTVGTTILQGRAFTDDDRTESARVAIVDESLAKLEFPSGEAVGKRVKVEPDAPWLTIVGVVRSIKHGDLAKAPDRYVYVPSSQFPQRRMEIIARSSLAPSAVTALLRSELAKLDPTLPLFDVHTIQEAVRASLDVQRLLYELLMAFALTALLLAAIGLYGLMSLHVTQRFREFGVRLALGASPATLRRMVLRGGVMLATIGVVVGLAGAAGATTLLRSQLFGVTPLDPLTFASVAAVLGAVVLVASYLPARRATSADPLIALREE